MYRRHTISIHWLVLPKKRGITTGLIRDHLKIFGSFVIVPFHSDSAERRPRATFVACLKQPYWRRAVRNTAPRKVPIAVVCAHSQRAPFDAIAVARPVPAIGQVIDFDRHHIVSDIFSEGFPDSVQSVHARLPKKGRPDLERCFDRTRFVVGKGLDSARIGQRQS